MSVRTFGMHLKFSESEIGLVSRLRDHLDGRPLAPILREAILSTARKITNTDAAEPAATKE
jgi:hypothetical protein